MRIIIITQDDPFYLQENLAYLLSLLPSQFKIVGCIVSDVSPFGKKDSFLKKAFKTYNIFGIKFFIYYSIKFIYSKIFNNSIKNFLKTEKITQIKLSESINNKSSLKLIKSFDPRRKLFNHFKSRSTIDII